MRRIVGLVVALALVGVTIGLLGVTGVWGQAANLVGLSGDEPNAISAPIRDTVPAAPPAPSEPPVISAPVPTTPVELPKPTTPPDKKDKDRNKRPCSADPSYFDKDPADLVAAAKTAWEQTVAAGSTQGVVLCIHSGKRSTAQQQAEFAAAVKLHGSEAIARQYVLPPAKSLHVKGLAVDVQPRASAAWLERSKGQYGWCRRYANEPWHFEYDASYASAGCPALLAHP